MKRLFCIAVFFCFAVSFCLTPRPLFSGEGEKEALLNSLRRMQEDWIENASFCGHFTDRSGDFTSEEEAMTAELPADAESESGFLAKLGHRYRGLFESGEDPENAVCIDFVSNDRFSLRIERRPVVRHSERAFGRFGKRSGHCGHRIRLFPLGLFRSVPARRRRGY